MLIIIFIIKYMNLVATLAYKLCVHFIFFASCLAQVNVKQKAQLQAQTTINWTNGEIINAFFFCCW